MSSHGWAMYIPTVWAQSGPLGSHGGGRPTLLPGTHPRDTIENLQSVIFFTKNSLEHAWLSTQTRKVPKVSISMEKKTWSLEHARQS